MDNEFNDRNGAGDGTANSYDYGFRMYEPRLGKFLSEDPLTADYPELTPYQYASNNPIANIDIDGAEGYYYVKHTWMNGHYESSVKVEADLHYPVSESDGVSWKPGESQTMTQAMLDWLNPEDKDKSWMWNVDERQLPVQFNFTSSEFPAPLMDLTKSAADMVTSTYFPYWLSLEWLSRAANPNLTEYEAYRNIVIFRYPLGDGRAGATYSLRKGDLFGVIGIDNARVVSTNAIGHTLAHEVNHAFMLYDSRFDNVKDDPQAHLNLGGIHVYGAKLPFNFENLRNMMKCLPRLPDVWDPLPRPKGPPQYTRPDLPRDIEIGKRIQPEHLIEPRK